ncbi:MAG: HlyD family secretion protein [Bacteroidota bacterium]
MAHDNEVKPQHQEHGTPKKKNKVFPIVLAVLVLAGGGFGVTKYIHAQHHEETDNAQVEANVSPVIPRIPGYVVDIRVRDNQQVKAGDTLVILDSRSETIKLAEAEAMLRAAQSNLGVASASTTASRANISAYQANVTTASAQIEGAKVTLRRATQDYERYSNLIKDHSITQQQFEQAEAAKQTAERQLQVLMDQRNAATRQTSAAAQQSNATAQQVNVVNATIQQRMAEVEKARLELSYTVITAAQDGRVSKVNAQIGQLVQTGQMLFSVVSESNPWVVANFKETQLSKMHPGQRVTVHVDAFPGKEFEAKLSSFSPATGAKFALLPPDNASGNFVKVVQRLPVRIEFANADPMLQQLRPGMNVAVDVHVD